MTLFPELDRFKGEGWQSQLDRVERWRSRLLEALSSSVDGLDDENVMDFLYAFVQAAHHLRDWIIFNGAATKTEIDTFIRGTLPLRQCQALCNGSKHVALDDHYKIAHVRMMREYVPPSTAYQSGGSRLRLIGFEMRSGGVDYEYVDKFIDDTVSAWRQFCATLPHPAT